MRIDEDLMFVDLCDDEPEELFDWAKAVIRGGTFPHPEPWWVQEWLDKAAEKGTIITPRIAAMACALPQRVTLSILEAALSAFDDGHG
jgi:hypothetical protein